MILLRLFTSRPGELRPKARERRGREKAWRVRLGSHHNQIQQMSRLVAVLFGTSLSLILLRFCFIQPFLRCYTLPFCPALQGLVRAFVRFHHVQSLMKRQDGNEMSCTVLKHNKTPCELHSVDAFQDNSMMAYLMCEHFLHSDAPILSRSYMRLWAEDLGVAATCPNIEEMLLGPWSLKDSFAKLRGELQSCSSSQILVPVKRHAFSKVIDIHRFIGFAVARSQLSFIDREEDFAAAPGPMAGSRENRI